MKVLLVNRNDTGGAAKACIRLHNGLLKHGIDSKLMLRTKTDHSIPFSYDFDSTLIKSSISERVIRKGKSIYKAAFPRRVSIKEKYLRNRNEKFEIFSDLSDVKDITQSKLYQEADIIHFHWVSDFVDYNFFGKNKKPVLWTLHDMNPFTGGCHYDGGIGKYRTDCSGCPQLAGTIDENYSRTILQNKKKWITKSVGSIHIISPSLWLQTQSKESSLFKTFKHYCIPNALDGVVFQPRDKSLSRQILGLPPDQVIFLFVAESVDNKRKGYSLLIEALAQIETDKPFLCVIGENAGIEKRNNIMALGFIRDELLMSMVYSAADVFVMPSLEDNLPSTVMESIMCGTPVIGFPIGGIVDMIKHKVNGLVCESVSAESLTNSLKEFIANPSIFNPNEIRKQAVSQYSLPIQTNAVIEVYKKALTVLS